MGNDQGKVQGWQYKKKFESELQYQLIKSRYDSDVLNQEVTLYRDSESKKHAACIEKYNQPEHFSPERIVELEARVKSRPTNLISVLGYYCNVDSDTLCGSSFAQCYYISHPIGTLRDEIQLRKFFNKPYDDLELWGFLRSIVNGLLELQKNDQPCRNISATTIYVNQEGFYQISELHITKDTTLFEEIAMKILAKDIYLAPKQIEAINNGDLIDPTNPFISDVFSLGVVAIELVYLEDQSDLFKYVGEEDEVGINISGLRERLLYREKTFSKTLIRLINQMIEEQEKDRITLEELAEELEINYTKEYARVHGESEQPLPETSLEQSRTNFIDELIHREEHAKKYKNGGNEPLFNDSEQQVIRRAFQNKIKNYQSKAVITDNSEEEEGDDSLQAIAAAPSEIIPRKDSGGLISNRLTNVLATAISTALQKQDQMNGISKLSILSLEIRLEELKTAREDLMRRGRDIYSSPARSINANVEVETIAAELEDNSQSMMEIERELELRSQRTAGQVMSQLRLQQQGGGDTLLSKRSSVSYHSSAVSSPSQSPTRKREQQVQVVEEKSISPRNRMKFSSSRQHDCTPMSASVATAVPEIQQHTLQKNTQLDFLMKQVYGQCLSQSATPRLAVESIALRSHRQSSSGSSRAGDGVSYELKRQARPSKFLQEEQLPQKQQAYTQRVSESAQQQWTAGKKQTQDVVRSSYNSESHQVDECQQQMQTPRLLASPQQYIKSNEQQTRVSKINVKTNRYKNVEDVFNSKSDHIPSHQELQQRKSSPQDIIDMQRIHKKSISSLLLISKSTDKYKVAGEQGGNVMSSASAPAITSTRGSKNAQIQTYVVEKQDQTKRPILQKNEITVSKIDLKTIISSENHPTVKSVLNTNRRILALKI